MHHFDVQTILASSMLDHFVAEKIFGWTYKKRPTACCQQVGWDSMRWPVFGPKGGGFQDVQVPKFSTQLPAAWTILERLSNAEQDAPVCPKLELRVDGQWQVSFVSASGSTATLASAQAETIALAIVRAALLLLTKRSGPL